MAERAEDWQPIETKPAEIELCWVGHAPSRTMLVGWQDKRCCGVWRIMWTDRIIPWAPTHWMSLPVPPDSAAETSQGRPA